MMTVDDLFAWDGDGAVPVEVFRARLHGLVQMVSSHEARMVEMRGEVSAARAKIAEIQETMKLLATQEQLKNSISLIDLQFKVIAEKLNELVTGKNWVIGVVFTLVIGAVLALVFKK